jgi:hypothetical protein
LDVKLGIFVVPDATDPESTIEQILAADRSGLDLIGVQDHPYQLIASVPGEDPIAEIRRLGEEAAPRLRELVG